MKLAARIVSLIAGTLFSLSVFSAVIVESVTGTVFAGGSVATRSPALVNQPIPPGQFVVTGPASRAVLRFDDGQAVALGQNTQFRVSAYTFVSEKPASDNIVVELLRGAMRSVTGLLARRNPQAFSLRIPQATIGIRGTDFMVAAVDRGYLSVLDGSIGATNAAGTVAFGAGATGAITSPTVLAAAIPANALPASVAAAFAQLSSLALQAAGAQGATEAAAGGVTPGAIAVGLAVAAGIAAASNEGGTPGTTGTTGTIPF